MPFQTYANVPSRFYASADSWRCAFEFSRTNGEAVWWFCSFEEGVRP